MYEIIKNIIAYRDYNLNDLLKKIDVVWLQGDLTDEQKTELIALAQDNARTLPNIDLEKALSDLHQQVTTLTQLLYEHLQNGEEPEDSDIPVADAYIEGMVYYTGDKTLFENAEYECIAPEGAVCVWSPKAYPAYWKFLRNIGE